MGEKIQRGEEMERKGEQMTNKQGTTTTAAAAAPNRLSSNKCSFIFFRERKSTPNLRYKMMKSTHIMLTGLAAAVSHSSNWQSYKNLGAVKHKSRQYHQSKSTLILFSSSRHLIELPTLEAAAAAAALPRSSRSP